MGMAVAAPDLEPAPRRRWWRRASLLPYALIAPSVAVIVGVLAFPLGMLGWLSLQKYGLRELIAHQGQWVGLDNYRLILTDALFYQVVFRTLFFTVACVALTLILSTLIALLLLKVRRAIRVLIASALVFVWATPVVVTIDIWQWMFDYEFGVINYLLTQLHIGNYIHHNWFENPLQGFTVITVIVVWGAIPFLALMLYAGLTQVPRELVEAAEIDGARPWQVFAMVTVPILRPLFLILFSLSTIWDFQVFNQVWVLLNQRPSKDYFLISVYSFQESFRVSKFGLGAAAAVLMVAILLVVTFVYVRQTVRLTTEEAV